MHHCIVPLFSSDNIYMYVYVSKNKYLWINTDENILSMFYSFKFAFLNLF